MLYRWDDYAMSDKPKDTYAMCPVCRLFTLKNGTCVNVKSCPDAQKADELKWPDAHSP